jgi:preprotein translocase subunit YajC
MINMLFLQAAPQQGWITMGTFGLMFLVMYFLILRPQSKKQKEIKLMLSALKKGDRVVTAGGIHGEVDAIKEDTGAVVVRVDDNVKIRFDKSAIVQVLINKDNNKSDLVK